MEKAIFDAIQKIKEWRPLNDFRWQESIRRLENCKFSVRNKWEPWKTFSMTPTKSRIRLAYNWMSWQPYPESQASNLLHESRHLLDLEHDGWFGFYIKYAQRSGRYDYELAAIKQNIRWWCRLGKIGVANRALGSLTPITHSYLQRVVDNFASNYLMGKKFDKQRMLNVLKDFVLNAYEEGYRIP